MKRIKLILTISLLFLFSACSLSGKVGEKKQVLNDEELENYSVATFSGGCFWCSESDFEKVDGVIEVISGFAGGKEENPTYKQVSSGGTSHREGIQVYYNTDKVSYSDLLDVYWKHIDPTDDEGQFVDRGFQYTSAIFYHNENQKKLAEKSKAELEKSKKFKKAIVTKILPFTSFYKAEEYHQDYYLKNPIRYKYYRGASGRDDFISEHYNDNAKKLNLTPLQYHVTQENGTEKPFDNEYWDNKEKGIYIDIISGKPLFSSTDKYESGTGWPSFTKPIDKNAVLEREDNKFLMKRTEISSASSHAHLGHVFNDGPKNSTGLRYCMNSAALKFVPLEKMKEQGYEKYLYLFE